MNTDLTTAAVERLTAQLGEALFNQPGLDLIEIANRCNKMAARSGGALLPETPLTGRILTVDEFKAPSAPFKNKPEAVRLRDELRERAEFEAWAQSIGAAVDDDEHGNYVDSGLNHAKLGWQAAIAAIGKQQVGDGIAETLEGVKAKLHPVEWSILMAGLSDARAAEQIGEVQGSGITADWVLGYLCTDAPEDSRDAIRNAFTEWNAAAARQPVCATCDGSRVDPGGKPACRDCVDARQPVGQEPVGVIRDRDGGFGIELSESAHDTEAGALDGRAVYLYPPAPAVDLRQFSVQVAELLRSELDLEVADPEDRRHDDGQGEAERLAARIAALIGGKAVRS